MTAAERFRTLHTAYLVLSDTEKRRKYDEFGATNSDLNIPDFDPYLFYAILFNSQTVGDVWRVPYQERADEAATGRQQHQIKPAATDKKRICLMAIDVQNTFCIPNFELFVGGQSGMGAVEDNKRLCEFIYRNLDVITEIAPTLDTHTAMQIFHPIFCS